MKSFRTSIVTAALLALSAGGIAAATAGDKGGSCSSSMPLASVMSPGNIVEVADGAGSFKTLLAAAKGAGLADTLAKGGPFTVFAPTDEAFAKLPKGTVETLLKPENKAKLAAILAYHVVPAKVVAADALKLSTADTVNGQRLALKVEGGSLFIDGAKVVKTDVNASNGVIHVVDSVIIPSDKDIVATADGAGMFKTLIAAAKAAGLAEALMGDGPLTVLAPTDDAFAKLPKGTVEELLKPENKGKLADILKLHVISGRVFSDQALKAGTASSLLGESLNFSAASGKATVNGAGIIKTDINAKNGVIHVIDSVLLPTGKKGAMNVDDAMPASALIAAAIDLGAPLFNNGQPEACTAVYEITAMSLLAREDVCGEAKASLRKAMKTAKHTHDASEKAWAMRSGLDAVSQMSGSGLSMGR